MLSDVRNAARALRAAPGFTAVALVVLTLGIGATTAIFSVVDAVVLRSLPFDRSDRLASVVLRDTTDGGASSYHTAQDFVDFRDQQDVFTAITATATGSLTITEGSRPESLRSARVTAGFFDVFRVTPALGRPFTAEHEVDGNHQVALISDGLWRRRFGADPGVVGSTIRFDEGTYQVFGVMPRDFQYPISARRPTDLVVPWVQPENQKIRANSRSYYLQVIGRLNDDATMSLAAERMKAITAAVADASPDWFRNREGGVQPLHETVVGDRTRSWMLMLLGAVAFVLLIACVNVANLLLARATSRARETGVRAALGASRWQIARGMLAESLLLSSVGTVLGLVVAWWGVGVLRAALPETLPRIADVGIDLRVLAATAGAALVTGVLFGLAPAIQFSRPNLTDALREGGRGTAGTAREWLRSSLVVAEVALAMVLLVGAGLFITSFVRLVNVEIGLDYRNVMTLGVYPSYDFSNPDERTSARARSQVAIPEMLRRVQALPGVEAAGLISGGLPLSGSWSRTSVRVPGRDEEFDGDDSVDIRQVTPGYGDAVGAAVLRGRYLVETDGSDGQQVVVLNEEAARRYLGDQDPIGRTIAVNGDRTVVGIVSNVRLGGPESDIRPEAYVPYAQSLQVGGELVVRTAGDPAPMTDAVRSAVWTSYPDIAIDEVTTMETLLGRLIAQRQFNMLLVGLFGALAMVIAGAGIYGVMAYIVTQRTQEIGVRMALGARPTGVLLTVLRRAAAFLVLGLAAGLAGAWVLASSIEAFLFQVDPRDATVFASTGVLLFVVGMVAALVPARRASRVDPLVALRN